jgi:hypothetical protein
MMIAPVSSRLKRYWNSCESKNALSNNEHSNASLKDVFSSADERWQVHEDIKDDACEQL